jgi:hypothetical protein
VRRISVALAGLVLTVALAASALATHTNLADADDVRGPLDIRTVVLRHEPGPYVWVFRTFASWTTRSIWDRGYFVVELDTRGSAAIDYVVVLRSDGRSMVGHLFRRQADGDEVPLRTLRAWRAGTQGAGVEVPRRFLRFGPNRTTFTWATRSSFTGDRCRATCLDRVPDGDAMVEQELQAPSPSPSPSVSPSVSPTASPTASPTP